MHRQQRCRTFSVSIDTSVWSRLALPAGATIEGPAILEQPDATTVIEPGHVGRVDALGNVIVEPA